MVAVSAMLSLAKQCAFEEPAVETITGENVLTWPHVVSKLVLLSLFIMTSLYVYRILSYMLVKVIHVIIFHT